MSEDKYTDITVGYLNAFLDVLRDKAVGTAGSPFRVIFISGKGADSKEKSRTLFARVKVRRSHWQIRLPWLIPPPQGHAENNLIKAVEESKGHLGASILRPGYFYPSKAYPQDAPNQRGLTLRIADKLISTPLSIFYPAGVISVEEIGQFALEAARGKWEAKSGPSPIFENEEMEDLLKSLWVYALNTISRSPRIMIQPLTRVSYFMVLEAEGVLWSVCISPVRRIMRI
jgi:hypothetical protein